LARREFQEIATVIEKDAGEVQRESGEEIDKLKNRSCKRKTCG